MSEQMTEQSTTDEKPRKSSKAKAEAAEPVEPKDKITQLAEALISLPAAERRALSTKLGIDLPDAYETMEPEDLDAPRVWGYRCKTCNKPALEFVGATAPKPLAFERLAWVQPELPEGKLPDRYHPRCQHCRRLVKRAGSRHNIHADRRYILDLDTLRGAIQATKDACAQVRRSTDRSSSAYRERQQHADSLAHAIRMSYEKYPNPETRAALEAVTDQLGITIEGVARKLPVATAEMMRR